MYAREHDNKVTIRCNAPSMVNMKQFWTEVQEYIDKGYRYSFSNDTGLMMESPVGQTFSRVTLEKVEAKVATKVATKEETPEATTKKTTAKKPAAKK